ncbi:DUF4276 family protein [Geobacter sulfurreducens]|uniref:DUF4276 family protein n=1 Tax=Geobacter sulfurreducens TaxID=35554 RepID=UPI000DBAE53A|nr:DUF4276 family protein [Geobacter sulfurreducens]BBA71027.1 hypothetical protein YM18_2509 [Geobacter sulfurreducens]
MKIGIIVDGQAESQAFRFITAKINIPNTQILAPLYADLQPRATPQQIVRSALGKIQILVSKNANKILLLIDSDDRRQCGAEFARDINQALIVSGYPNAQAVVKIKCYENWLIADTDSIAKMKNRFKITSSFEHKVKPNKADNINDPEDLLNSITIRTRYKKGKDSVEISRYAEPDKIGSNSRSFRKLLNLLGHPKYLRQSKYP